MGNDVAHVGQPAGRAGRETVEKEMHHRPSVAAIIVQGVADSSLLLLPVISIGNRRFLGKKKLLKGRENELARSRSAAEYLTCQLPTISQSGDYLFVW